MKKKILLTDDSQYIYRTKPLYEFIKRIFDIILAIFFIFILSPLILFIIILLKIKYKKNIFYFQERVGKNKKIFKIIKFRTMHINAETQPVWASENDVRCTKIGKFLRKTSIDELPQLINIIKGDMSLIGPRPERPYFMKDHPLLNGKRTLLAPGLTGLAQVNGRYKLTIDEKLKFDLEYLQNRCLWLDIKILLKTIPIVLSRSGAW
jgi:lipopolysaccharide/colanic/teichoic acid biosynthesis glycosyltransferase